MADNNYDNQQPPEKQDVVRDIADIFRKKGLTESGVRGILANTNDESKFDPTIRQPDQPKWSGEAHYAHGLYQEGGGEWNNYAAWLATNHPDKNWQDHKLQTEFLADNLQQNYPHVWDAMQKGSPEQAANAFLTGYLKPRADFRDERSKRYSQGIPDVEYYLNNVRGSFSKGRPSPQPESPYLSNSEVNEAFAEYAPPQSNSFAKYLKAPTEYAKGAARDVARVPSHIVDYYNNLPGRTEPIGAYNTIIGGGNALLDAIPRTITSGKYGIADVEDAIGLPSSRTRDSIQAFHNAYAPAIQTAKDVGMAGLGVRGVSFPESAPATVSRGAEAINSAVDTGATAFENAAKNAGNPNQLNVFAPINPVDPRFAQAAKLRGVNQVNPGMTATDVYKNASGAFFEPSGRLLKNIPDTTSRLSGDIASFQPGYVSKLGNVLDHPDLYHEYPGMANIPVKFVSGENNYSRYPMARVGEKGDVVVSLPREMARNPDIMNDRVMQKELKNQLIKVAQYDIERTDPFRSASFRDKPRVEENILNAMADRVDRMASNEPPLNENVSTTPVREYSKYLHSFQDKIAEARGLADDPEAFVQNEIVASGQYGKTLKARIALKKENGQPLRLKSKEVDEAIASGIHQISAGTQGAQYVARNTNAGTPFPTPYANKSFADSFVRFRPEITDKELMNSIHNWYNYGNARENQNKRGPYRAEGGPVFMNNYNNRMSARNGYSGGYSGGSSGGGLSPTGRYGGGMGNGIGGMGGGVQQAVQPTTPAGGGMGGRMGFGVQHAANGGEVTGSPDGDARISPDGMVQDPSGSTPTADAVDANVPEGSHVIPYDALVKLGDGDPDLGKERLMNIIQQIMVAEAERAQNEANNSQVPQGEQPPENGMKRGGAVSVNSARHVPVRVSNQELILSPEHVSAIGRGNMEKGHHHLNAMRMKLRGAN